MQVLSNDHFAAAPLGASLCVDPLNLIHKALHEFSVASNDPTVRPMADVQICLSHAIRVTITIDHNIAGVANRQTPAHGERHQLKRPSSCNPDTTENRALPSTWRDNRKWPVAGYKRLVLRGA